MIEFDVVNLLESDTEMASLLEATALDTKIYPIQLPQGTEPPALLYVVSSEGTYLENINEVTLSFSAVGRTYKEAKQIIQRLDFLLNREHEIQNIITSSEYYIYWAKKTGGLTYKETDLGRFYRTSVCDFKYNSVRRATIDMLYKTLAIKVTGTLIDEEVVFDGFYFPATTTIIKVSLHCRTAPEGSALTVDLLKNDTEQSRIATLADGVKNQVTDISDIAYLSSDKFGIKVKSVGSSFEGEDLTVVIYYQ